MMFWRDRDDIFLPEVAGDIFDCRLVEARRAGNLAAIEINRRLIIGRDARTAFTGLVEPKSLPKKTNFIGFDGLAFIIVPDPLCIGPGTQGQGQKQGN